jgi:hypothetical protein
MRRSNDGSGDLFLLSGIARVPAIPGRAHGLFPKDAQDPAFIPPAWGFDKPKE